MRKKLRMKLKDLLIFIGILGLLIKSCQSKKSNQTVKSEFLTDSIFSQSLSEYRRHNVYLPKGFSQENKYPIIYATDGNSQLTDKKKTLDSLIENEIIKPVIFVASFANNKIADSTSVTTGNGKKVKLGYRNFEYINDYASTTKDSSLASRFENHKSYFVEELIQNIEKKYNQDNGKEYRYFYGVSNGAGFGMSLLNQEPELIGTYLCFSTFGGDIQSNSWNENTNYPNLYLKYGSEEPFFLKEDAEFLKVKYADSNSFIEIEEFIGGHNNKFWEKEFIETVEKILN
jgi:enterochelin esterase-like enzyme